MSRKSFVLYTEWEDAFDGQPNDIAGELIKQYSTMLEQKKCRKQTIL